MADGDARVVAAEKAGARVAALLKDDITSHCLLIAALTEELTISKAAIACGSVAFDEAKLAFKLEQTANLVGKLQGVLESAEPQAVRMSTQLRRISSLDVVRMENFNYYDRMEKAEGLCHKLKTKLDQLIVHKDTEELFRFGLGVLPRGAVLQRAPVANPVPDVGHLTRRIDEVW